MPLEKLLEYYDVPFLGKEAYQPVPRAFPKQNLPVITALADGKELRLAHWGLRPAWMKNLVKSKELINVRADSLLGKPSMRRYLDARCLIPATGFFEWKTEADGKKTLYTFKKKDAELFSMAGVLTMNDAKHIGGYAIVTSEPNDYVRPIHNRMPLILTRDEERVWLSSPIENAREFLRLIPEARLNPVAFSG